MDKSIDNLEGFLKWALFLYITKDEIKDGLSFSNEENRNFFAEMGIELTPSDYKHFAEAIKKMVDVIEWYDKFTGYDYE